MDPRFGRPNYNIPFRANQPAFGWDCASLLAAHNGIESRSADALIADRRWKHWHTRGSLGASFALQLSSVALCSLLQSPPASDKAAQQIESKFNDNIQTILVSEHQHRRKRGCEFLHVLHARLWEIQRSRLSSSGAFYTVHVQGEWNGGGVAFGQRQQRWNIIDTVCSSALRDPGAWIG